MTAAIPNHYTIYPQLPQPRVTVMSPENLTPQSEFYMPSAPVAQPVTVQSHVTFPQTAPPSQPIPNEPHPHVPISVPQVQMWRYIDHHAEWAILFQRASQVCSSTIDSAASWSRGAYTMEGGLQKDKNGGCTECAAAKCE